MAENRENDVVKCAKLWHSNFFRPRPDESDWKDEEADLFLATWCAEHKAWQALRRARGLTPPDVN